MVQKDRWASRILESARDAILVMDAGGLVLQANDAADALLWASRAGASWDRGCRTCSPSGRRPAPAGGTGDVSSNVARGAFDVELTTSSARGHPALQAAFLREPPPYPRAGPRPRAARARRPLARRHVLRRVLPVLGVGNGAGPLGSDHIRGLIHPAEGQAVRDLLAALKRQPGRTAQAGIETATRLLRPDGTLREIRLRGRVDRDEQGELAFAVGVVQDVSGPRTASASTRDALR